MIDIQDPLEKPGTHEWEELRLDQIGATLQKYRRPGGGEKNSRQQIAEKEASQEMFYLALTEAYGDRKYSVRGNCAKNHRL